MVNRAADANDTRQLAYTRPVYDEASMRAAIAEAARADPTTLRGGGLTALIVSPFTTTKTFIIPRTATGFNIISNSRVPIKARGILASLFDVRADFVTIRGLFVFANSLTNYFTSFVITTGSPNNTIVDDNVVTADRIFVTDGGDSASIRDNYQTRVNATHAAPIVAHNSTLVEGNTLHDGGGDSITVTGSHCRLLANDTGGGDITTTAGTGSNILALTTTPGTKTLHATDRDDDAPELAVPGGSSGYVQYNNAGAFGGDAELSWDHTNKRLGVGTATPTTKIDALVTASGDGVFVHTTTASVAVGVTVQNLAGIAQLGVAGINSDWAAGALAGDVVLDADTAGTNLCLAANNVTRARAKSVGFTADTFACGGGDPIASTWGLSCVAAVPVTGLKETGAGTDEKLWANVAVSGDWYFQAVNDALDNGSNIIKVTRTGITVDSVSLYAGIAGSAPIANVLPTRVETPQDFVSRDAAKGLVLKSPNGHYWRQTIDNAGATTWADLGTSPP